MHDESPLHSDADIVHQVLDGNVNAFEILMERHGDYILNIVKKHVPPEEVEETVQEAFIRAYKSLSSYRGKSKLKYWLSSIAVRTCSDYWRRAYRSKEVPLSSLTEKHQRWLEDTISDQSDRAYRGAGTQRETRELLVWALQKLSPQDRMVLELVYLEGLSGKEAAELLGWSHSNVKVRSFRSRKKLRKILGEVLDA